MDKICPHCFGKYQERDGVSLSHGVEICDACADGSAAFAAFEEWLNTKTSKTFAEWMLESIGNKGALHEKLERLVARRSCSSTNLLSTGNYLPGRHIRIYR
jgi:hypothetical protein